MNNTKKDGSIIAKSAVPICSVKDLYAKNVQNKYAILMTMNVKKLYIREMLKLILDFLPNLCNYANIIKKNIRNYIIKKKVKKWGRGIFIDSHNYEDIYCYMPSQDCRLWRAAEIDQTKYVEHCCVCEKKFTMGPYSLSSIISFGGYDDEWDEYELIQSYCINCYPDEQNFLVSSEYKLINYPFTRTSWIWPSKNLTNPLYVYLKI